MRPQMNLRQYRAMDLTMLTVIGVVCEALIVRAGTVWFPRQPYTFSVLPALCGIVMIRWGLYAAVPLLLTGLAHSLLLHAGAAQLAVYTLGGLLMLSLWPAVRKLGWRWVTENGSRCVMYGLCCALSAQLGRALLALILGQPLSVADLYITTDALSGVFSMVVMWIARRLDGILEEQRHYLDRVSREQQSGGMDE